MATKKILRKTDLGYFEQLASIISDLERLGAYRIGDKPVRSNDIGYRKEEEPNNETKTQHA